MELNNKPPFFSDSDLEKMKESIAQLSYFYWTNHSEEDQIMHVRHFSQEGDLFEHDYSLVANKHSWFSLAPGTAYFYYKNEPLEPIKISENRNRYYFLIHIDETIRWNI